MDRMGSIGLNEMLNGELTFREKELGENEMDD